MNWIIGGIFKEIQSTSNFKFKWRTYPETLRQVSRPKNLISLIRPMSSHLNVFATHKLFFRHGHKAIGPKRLMLTQILDDSVLEKSRNIDALNTCERILVQNITVRDALETVGVNSSLIQIFPGAIDREVFFPASENGLYVLISGDFKDRKNPELIAKVIKTNLDLKFVVHGKNLDIIKNFDSGPGRNVKYIPWDKTLQPSLMRKASVCLVLSKHEGGPFTILEALASGTPVVSTDVGFAKEHIDSTSGIILSGEPSLDVIRNGLDLAFTLKPKTSGTDLLRGKFTWLEYGELLFGE